MIINCYMSVFQFGLSASDIATEIGRLDIVSTIKDFSIRNEYQSSQKTLNSASKPKEKDDIAVKKCCVILWSFVTLCCILYFKMLCLCLCGSNTKCVPLCFSTVLRKLECLFITVQRVFIMYGLVKKKGARVLVYLYTLWHQNKIHVLLSVTFCFNSVTWVPFT